MLLSVYVSYLSERRFRQRISVLFRTIFLISASGLSAFIPYVYLWFAVYPLGFLSFPFYSSVDQMHSWELITAYNINLLTARILVVSPEDAVVLGFIFFLSINLIGSFLGHLLNKKLPELPIEEKMFNIFFKWAIASFLVCYFLFWITLLFVLGPQPSTTIQVLTRLLINFYMFFSWVPAAIATATYWVFRRRMARKTGDS